MTRKSLICYINQRKILTNNADEKKIKINCLKGFNII